MKYITFFLLSICTSITYSEKRPIKHGAITTRTLADLFTKAKDEGVISEHEKLGAWLITMEQEPCRLPFPKRNTCADRLLRRTEYVTCIFHAEVHQLEEGLLAFVLGVKKGEDSYFGSFVQTHTPGSALKRPEKDCPLQRLAYEILHYKLQSSRRKPAPVRYATTR